MKRCGLCKRAVDDASGLVNHKVCPWCAGELADDLSGPRTLADAVQILWSMDSEAPYDGRRAQNDLRDLCPGLPGVARDIRTAGNAGALKMMKENRVQAARKTLQSEAHWTVAFVDEFMLAYESLDTNAPKHSCEQSSKHEEQPHQDSATEPSHTQKPNAEKPVNPIRNESPTRRPTQETSGNQSKPVPPLNLPIQFNRPSVSAGGAHTVGLRSNGTVVARGSASEGQCSMSRFFGAGGAAAHGSSMRKGPWRDVVAVAAGGLHTVGLLSNGTVVAIGNNKYGQCEIGEWSNVVAISAGDEQTVGLLSSGRVVSTRGDTRTWNGITAVSAGRSHVVGLRFDGTVVAAGSSPYGQCDVGGWQDVIAIAAGGAHTVGLLRGGRVVATGANYDSQCEVGEWRDIVAISAGSLHTVGLVKDGSVVATGYNKDGRCNVGKWHKVKAVSAGGVHTVALMLDGFAKAVGSDGNEQCAVTSWRL